MDEKEIKVGFCGIEHIAQATSLIATKSIEGIESFLKIVCKPACDEFGLYLGDNVRNWRLKNILNILEQSKNKLEFTDDKLNLKIDPKIALGIIENGSLTEDINLQEFWAGLFAASCTENSTSDENIIFIDILKKITSTQAKILKYACEESKKYIYDDEFIIAEKVNISVDILKNITGIDELYKLDRELDYLTNLNLIGEGIIAGSGGINIQSKMVNITPTSLTLNMYVKFQGFNKHPKMYWKQELIKKSSSELKITKVLGF